MWKFIPNVEKPKPVLKQSEAEKRKYQLEYEKNKRQRKFQSDCSVKSWLQESENGLLCSVCVNFSNERDSMFIKGCQSYNIDSINKHKITKSHEKSMFVDLYKKNPGPLKIMLGP